MRRPAIRHEAVPGLRATIELLGSPPIHRLFFCVNDQTPMRLDPRLTPMGCGASGTDAVRDLDSHRLALSRIPAAAAVTRVRHSEIG